MDGAQIMAAVMTEMRMPFGLGAIPARPNPQYPLTHNPDSHLMELTARAMSLVETKSASPKAKEEAVYLILLQLYQHGYKTGYKHGVESKKSVRTTYDKNALCALIRQHWRLKSDAEIGALMNPQVSAAVVRNVRLGLSLLRRE